VEKRGKTRGGEGNSEKDVSRFMPGGKDYYNELGEKKLGKRENKNTGHQKSKMKEMCPQRSLKQLNCVRPWEWGGAIEKRNEGGEERKLGGGDGKKKYLGGPLVVFVLCTATSGGAGGERGEFQVSLGPSSIKMYKSRPWATKGVKKRKKNVD